VLSLSRVPVMSDALTSSLTDPQSPDVTVGCQGKEFSSDTSGQRFFSIIVALTFLLAMLPLAASAAAPSQKAPSPTGLKLKADPSTDKGAVSKASPAHAVGKTPAPKGMLATATAAQKSVATYHGSASWYGPGFHGRRSADGSVFNMHQLTAAHRSLPFGTLARVTNKKTGQSCLVKVTDRGPFIAGRVMDVSRGAAEALGMISSGIAPVQVEVLSYPVSHSYIVKKPKAAPLLPKIKTPATLQASPTEAPEILLVSKPDPVLPMAFKPEQDALPELQWVDDTLSFPVENTLNAQQKSAMDALRANLKTEAFKAATQSAKRSGATPNTHSHSATPAVSNVQHLPSKVQPAVAPPRILVKTPNAPAVIPAQASNLPEQRPVSSQTTKVL